LRLSLQTREQHIRREKATSNICTAQALLANMAALYAVYHGPEGLKAIATRVHQLARLLAAGLEKLGGRAGKPSGTPYFDTLRVELGERRAAAILELAEARQINLRQLDEHAVGIALNECASESDVAELLEILNGNRALPFILADLSVNAVIPAPFARASAFLTAPVFHRYHAETEMLRYLKRLESRDLSLCHSMIPLGSCTMKLNAAAEMYPVSWPEFGRIHPFAPARQTQGYQALFEQLEQWLGEITGFAGVSLQPNAGSQGEYAGLLVIRKHHASRGEGHRNVCLIPASAHGTNPASAVMAGLKVVAVACDRQGNIDVDDLRAKAALHQNHLAALMVTYPSTHGVFEDTIHEICQIVHQHGGQVYMDGANLNAQVGLCRPGDIGADVCHLNLHKTFCIPHGGGGPGVGPVCVVEDLVPFLPAHRTAGVGQPSNIGAVSAAPLGNAAVLPISWMYIRMMGAEGLKKATEVAILSANRSEERRVGKECRSRWSPYH